ncbi:MAG: hypothetical protein Q4B68_05570 [Bacteroidales bacterium]|nr:hypothetical protein [Bacteroidales bacterium]
MKKSLLFAGFAALALCASAQNPFAYGLKMDGVTAGVVTGTAFTVNYSLNADAESAGINVIKISDMSVAKTVALEGEQLKKGTHAVEITTDGLEADVEYGYMVQTKGAAIDAAKEIFSDFTSGSAHQYWSPYGLACDNNPNSAHFGRVLITECQGNMGGTYFAKASGVGVGLYEYDPQGNPVANQAGTYGYNPFQWTSGTYQSDKSAKSQKFQLKKVRISHDGRIFLGCLNTVNNPIYTVNPDNLGEWTPLFEGTIDADASGLVMANETDVVAGPSAAFDVCGEGESTKIVNLASIYGQSYAYGNYTCYEYPIGASNTWSAPATDEVMPYSLQYTISAQSVSVAYDEDGNGIWYCQYRGAPTDAQPAIKHVTWNATEQEWVEDYSDITTVARGGAIAFNKDYSLLAFPGGNNLLKVYEVSKSEAGAPVLTEKYSVSTSTVRGFNDICFDYANNIYVCDNGKEVMQQIQLPIADPTTQVPCPENQLFTVATPTAVTDINCAKVATKKVIENGQVVIIKGDKKYNVMGAEVK